MIYHLTFISAIHEKRVLRITFMSKGKGVITRLCAPLDYGPIRSSGNVYPPDKYFVFDLTSPEGPHPLHLETSSILVLENTNEFFNPLQLVSWNPDWNIVRDWVNHYE